MPFPILLVAGLVIGGGAIAIAAASSSSSSSSSSGGKGGGATGNPFGKAGDYVDPLNTASGQLKDAGEQAKAKSEAEGKKDFSKWAGIIGGSQGKSYADDIYSFGQWLSHLLYGDEYDKANSDDQKARLTADVGKILSMGFPPAGLVSYEDFGARDVADRIESEFDAMNQVSSEGDAGEIGRAAIYSAVNGGPDVQKTILDVFKRMSNPNADAFGTGTMWTNGGAAPTYLVDGFDPVFVKGVKQKQGRAFRPGDRPEIDYAAAAAAGLYGATLDDALATAYAALNSYASRRGYTTRNDFFVGPAYKPRDPQVTDDISNFLNRYGKADSIVDAWRNLKLRYDYDYQQKKKDQAAAIGTAMTGSAAPALHL